MYDDLQTLLRARYELVSNRITALKGELEMLEPELDHLLKLISTYSKRDHDVIEEERKKIFTPVPIKETPAPSAPMTTDGRKAYVQIPQEAYEALLKEMFEKHNNTAMTTKNIEKELNTKLTTPMSHSTMVRVLGRAINHNVLKTMKRDGERLYQLFR